MPPSSTPHDVPRADAHHKVWKRPWDVAVSVACYGPLRRGPAAGDLPFPHDTGLPEPHPPANTHPPGLVDHTTWVALMGYDPSRGRLRFGEAIERVSLFEAVALANRLSERDGLPPCYSLVCEPHPDDVFRTPNAPAVHVGCPLLDQLFCVDPRRCVATRLDAECGYRLPTPEEWRTSGRHDGELAEWLWEDNIRALDTSESTLVAGRSRLSSSTIPKDRMAPTLASMKASHIGFRLVRDDAMSAIQPTPK